MVTGIDKMKQLINAKVMLECSGLLEARGVSATKLLSSDEDAVEKLVERHLTKEEIGQIVSTVEQELSEMAEELLF